MKRTLIFFLVQFCLVQLLEAGGHWYRAVNLKGRWRFEIGDNPVWAQPNFDDAEWDILYAPAFWEDQDYPGYDGYAWYRRAFEIPEKLRSEMLYLNLGRVDDVDQVFLNGTHIGSTGSFPPEYRTAYDVYREYFIPKSLVRFGGENVLAVRVFDRELGGGIVEGEPGIYVRADIPVTDLDLSGYWKFKTGDDFAWSEPDWDDADWQKIIAPGFWEAQGFPDYDGAAWYRKHFQLPSELVGKRLVLLLAKIDDVDEVFLNGKKIGSTGPFPDPDYRGLYHDWYLKDRRYDIPQNLLNPDGDNVIAVRVFDTWIDGGFHDAPIGLIEQEKLKAEDRNSWDLEKIIRFFLE